MSKDTENEGNKDIQGHQAPDAFRTEKQSPQVPFGRECPFYSYLLNPPPFQRRCIGKFFQVHRLQYKSLFTSLCRMKPKYHCSLPSHTNPIYSERLILPSQKCFLGPQCPSRFGIPQNTTDWVASPKLIFYSLGGHSASMVTGW